jgi:hypothetical protein
MATTIKDIIDGHVAHQPTMVMVETIGDLHLLGICRLTTKFTVSRTISPGHDHLHSHTTKVLLVDHLGIIIFHLDRHLPKTTTGTELSMLRHIVKIAVGILRQCLAFLRVDLEVDILARKIVADRRFMTAIHTFLPTQVQTRLLVFLKQTTDTGMIGRHTRTSVDP